MNNRNSVGCNHYFACLLVLALPISTANGTLVSETFSTVFTTVTTGGSVASAVGNDLAITVAYDTLDFTEFVAGVYTADSPSISVGFSADGGAEAFGATSFGSVDLQLVVNSVQDTLTLTATSPSLASWTLQIQDPDGSALSSTGLPTDISGFATIGTVFDFTGLTTPSGGGATSTKTFQATAIPEPSAFLFGGLVCGILGLGGLSAKRRRAQQA
jgi:hypothetical protein